MKKVVVLLALFFPILSLAQGLNADGKDYYIGWLYPSYNSQKLSFPSVLNFFQASVLVSSYSDNNIITITYFDNQTGAEVDKETYTISKRRSKQIPINMDRMRMDAGGPNGFDGEVAQWRSMHISSTKPINVQFFSSGANSGGSYLAIPTNFLGKNYVVESYSDNTGGAGGLLSHENSSGYFMVIAAYDGTTVQITPNATTKVKQAPGVNCGQGANGTPQPFTVSLKRGQCYMVKSQGSNSCDISGSTVVSDKPVAVIAGHEDAFTNGSDVGTIHVEGRDYMVEQMLPVEYWDSTGYISIPFIDSKSAQGGDGDNLAFFYGKPQGAPASYPKSATVMLLPQVLQYSISPFPASTPIKAGVTTATSASCDKRVKMHVVQYDQRMQGGAPYPAPSQMTLIPKSCWKTSFLWYTPGTTAPEEQYQSNYINLICDKNDFSNGTLQWSQDNGPFTPIKSAGSVNGIKQIPGNPDLMGMVVKLSPGRTYYMQSTIDKLFMVYTYGFRALDPQQALGTFNGDDQFYSYASPAGFAAMPADTPTFSVKTTTGCADWDLCVTVKGSTEPHIKSMALLNDPSEDFVDKPNSTTGYVSFNTYLDPKVDSNHKGEVIFDGTDTTECIKIKVINPLQPAYAAVITISDQGRYILTEFTYSGSPLSDTIKGTDFDLTKSPWQMIGTETRYHADTILYPITGLGDSHCATTFYYATGDSASGAKPIVVKGLKLGKSDSSFSVNTSPSVFPITLRPKSPSHPADTLKVSTCFSPKDIYEHSDTVTISTDCFDAPLLLYGSGGTPIIRATDLNFGEVLIGTTKCGERVTVSNVGTLPFILTSQWVFTNIIGDTEFSMEQQSAARLQPGHTLWPANDPLHPRQDTINLNFCYSPTEVGFNAATVLWKTSIKPPYDVQGKPSSYLQGKGINLGVNWDMETDTLYADSGSTPPIIIRDIANLIVQSTHKMRVDRVFFSGPDADEFMLDNNQLHQTPLEGFDMNPGDTIWVAFSFIPDLTKPYPQKFADRHANLDVIFFRDAAHTQRDTSRIKMTGTFLGKLSVSNQSTNNTLKAYYYNKQIIVELPENNIQHHTFSLYDILGREVHSWKKQDVHDIGSEIILAIPPLASGMYVLRVGNDAIVRSCTIIIQ